VAGDGFFVGDQFYGGFMEFGTKVRTTRSGAGRGAIVPRKFEFLRPAIYDNQTQIRKLFVDAVKQFIREA